MKLYVDNREKKLYSLLTAFNFSNQSECVESTDKQTTISKKHTSDDLSIEIKQLEIGDLILCDDSDNILIVFERKSIGDLASSIHDGRYKEQSERLSNFPITNHNIIYIIEGNIDRIYKSKIKSTTLKSCVVSLNLSKGFSTLKTVSIDDTARWVLAYCYKITGDKVLKTNLVNCDTNKNNDCLEKPTETIQPSSQHLSHLANQAKSKYTTRDNIHILMLSLVPKVSSVSATAILTQYNTLDNLISNLKNDPACLDNIKTTTNGKHRRLGKNVIQNIIEFLL